MFIEGQSGWKMATWELTLARYQHCASAVRCDRKLHFNPNPNTLLFILKGTWQWGGFSGVLQKVVPHKSLTLLFRPIRFWLRILGDIHIRKTTPRYHRSRESQTLRIGDTGSRRLPVSLSRGVDNSPHHWYAESATPRITDTESRLLNFFLKKTLCIDDTESHWLPLSLSRRVAGSMYHRYGESRTPRMAESGSRRLRVSG